MQTTRRGFLSGIIAAAAAPAIVRASSLMPIVVPSRSPWFVTAESLGVGLMGSRHLQRLRDEVKVWIAEPDYGQVWTDAVKNEFPTTIDPVSSHSLMLTGEIGRIYGMTIVSSPFTGSDKDRIKHERHRKRNEARSPNVLQQLMDKARDLSTLRIRS